MVFLEGGSRTYVSQVVEHLGVDNLHLNAEVKIVREEGRAVIIERDKASIMTL